MQINHRPLAADHLGETRMNINGDVTPVNQYSTLKSRSLQTLSVSILWLLNCVASCSNIGLQQSWFWRHLSLSSFDIQSRAFHALNIAAMSPVPTWQKQLSMPSTPHGEKPRLDGQTTTVSRRCPRGDRSGPVFRPSSSLHPQSPTLCMRWPPNPFIPNCVDVDCHAITRRLMMLSSNKAKKYDQEQEINLNIVTEY